MMFVPITPHRPSSSHDVSNKHLLEKKIKTGSLLLRKATSPRTTRGLSSDKHMWPIIKGGKKIKIKEDRDDRRKESV